MTSIAVKGPTEARQGTDIVDALAGIPPGTPLHTLRAQRADVASYAQGSYLALLEPDDPAGVSRVARELIALRIAVLTGRPGGD